MLWKWWRVSIRSHIISSVCSLWGGKASPIAMEPVIIVDVWDDFETPMLNYGWLELLKTEEDLPPLWPLLPSNDKHVSSRLRIQCIWSFLYQLYPSFHLSWQNQAPETVCQSIEQQIQIGKVFHIARRCSTDFPILAKWLIAALLRMLPFSWNIRGFYLPRMLARLDTNSAQVFLHWSVFRRLILIKVTSASQRSE